MTDRLHFETQLEERLRARAALASRPFDAAAIARRAVAVNGRRRRLGRLEWPSARPALGWLVMALLLAIALLGALAGVGALLRGPDPVSAERMTVIRQQVDAINEGDAEAFADSFAPGAHFNPGGDFRGMLFSRSLPVAKTSSVEAWMTINEAWGFEAEIIACGHDAEARSWAVGDEAFIVTCVVATRWSRLSLEITERWSFEFHGPGLDFWGYGLLDLNPHERALPFGYDGLEAWEAWLAATDPPSAARYLNPRSSEPACEFCWNWQSSLAAGGPEWAARVAPLIWGAENDWSIAGHDFAPGGLIPYDPAFASEIEASIREYLDSSISDHLETRP